MSARAHERTSARAHERTSARAHARTRERAHATRVHTRKDTEAHKRVGTYSTKHQQATHVPCERGHACDEDGQTSPGKSRYCNKSGGPSRCNPSGGACSQDTPHFGSLASASLFPLTRKIERMGPKVSSLAMSMSSAQEVPPPQRPAWLRRVRKASGPPPEPGASLRHGRKVRRWAPEVGSRACGGPCAGRGPR